MDVTLAEAKRDFERGFIKGFRAYRESFIQDTDGWHGSGWKVEFTGILGAGTSWLVDTRTKKVRIFKSLDGLASTLESVGFRVDTITA